MSEIDLGEIAARLDRLFEEVEGLKAAQRPAKTLKMPFRFDGGRKVPVDDPQAGDYVEELDVAEDGSVIESRIIVVGERGSTDDEKAFDEFPESAEAEGAAAGPPASQWVEDDEA